MRNLLVANKFNEWKVIGLMPHHVVESLLYQITSAYFCGGEIDWSIVACRMREFLSDEEINLLAEAAHERGE